MAHPSGQHPGSQDYGDEYGAEYGGEYGDQEYYDYNAEQDEYYEDQPEYYYDDTALTSGDTSVPAVTQASQYQDLSSSVGDYASHAGAAAGYERTDPRVGPPRIPGRGAIPPRPVRPPAQSTSASGEGSGRPRPPGPPPSNADPSARSAKVTEGARLLRPEEVKKQTVAQQQPSKISDDASIPRVATVNEAVHFASKPQVDSLAPSCMTPYIASDQGNTTPRYLRMTLYNVPNTASISDRCCLTLGAIAQPFANPSLGEEPIPVVNMGKAGPIRCEGCRGYLNAHCHWKNGGKVWVCNLCGLENECPSHYRSALDGNNLRRDRNEKPELHLGSVDFVAPDDLQMQLRKNPGIVFVIDVSPNAYGRGIVELTVQSIRDSIYELRATIAQEMTEMGCVLITVHSTVLHYVIDCVFECRLEPFEPEESSDEKKSEDESGSAAGAANLNSSSESDELLIKSDCKLRMGFITYDANSIHFHSMLDEGGSLDVISQIDDPFVAIPIDNDILVPLMCSESRYLKFDSLLARLPELFDPRRQSDSDPKIPESKTDASTSSLDGSGTAAKSGCVTAAISVASQILSKCGGKILALQSELNGIGVGSLVNRERSEWYNTTRELSLLSTNGVSSAEYYESLMQQCASNFVTVDLFCFSLMGSGYTDLSTMSTLCRSTGGQLYYYRGSDTMAFERFSADMKQNLTRYQVFNGIMAVRASRGLEIAEYIGSLILSDMGGEVQVPCFTADWNVALRFNIYESLDSHDVGGGVKKCSVQLAFLYTSIYRNETKIRLHNICLPIVKRIPDVFRCADMDAILNFSLKQLGQELIATSLILRDSCETKVSNIREAIVDACCSILCSYRRYVASSNPARQLVLPEALKLLPLFTLGMIKSPVLSDYLTSDDRIYEICRCLAMPAKLLSVTYVYCSIYAVIDSKSQMKELKNKEDSTVKVDPLSGRVFLPDRLKATRESLKSTGLYVCQSRDINYICIGEEMDSELFEQAFVVNGHQIELRADFDDSDPFNLGYLLSLLLDEINYDLTYNSALKIVMRPDTSNPDSLHLLTSEQQSFLSIFSEDATSSSDASVSAAASGAGSVALEKMAYTDFLVHCHKSIRAKLAMREID